VIVGTALEDVIVARAGNDVVRARGGADVVCGGTGNDRLSGGSSPLRRNHRGDRISGDEGDDRIVERDGIQGVLLGGPGDDYLASKPRRYSESKTLKGGAGADRLIGSLDDTLRGGPGPDTLSSLSDSGYRTLAGGPGPDVLNLAGHGDIVLSLTADGDHIRTRGAVFLVLLYQGSPGPIEVDLAAGTVRLVGAATGDVITHLGAPESTDILVDGTDGDDRMNGGDSDDSMRGLAGNDVLSGRGGDDGLYGGPGNDVLDGGEGGFDRVDGGSGSDTCTNAERTKGCSP
jgi:Ca2+-binding RTX toxin-like protein